MMKKEVDNLSYQQPSSWYVLALHSEWKGDSQFRIRVSKLKEANKIKVDVFELSRGKMADKRTAIRLATNHARGFEIASANCTTLCDFRADKKAETLDGQVVLVKRRQCSYVFSGVN